MVDLNPLQDTIAVIKAGLLQMSWTRLIGSEPGNRVYFEGLKSKNLINQHRAKKKTESKLPDEEDLGPRQSPFEIWKRPWINPKKEAFDGEGNDNQDNYNEDEKPVGVARGLGVIDQILIARWITEEETEIR
ncbi:hypothetical protein PPACK8108_LOCUS7560 [Phakopsora pachyrhizi]|uniref:Uncharacterized protein n=1 Tax=Phakopsora pachyrhizi TaxID=170000 RepID=A0AAV0AUH6_PHAPC|nr:hypothetical protein PPACK8108_LOCUS7560 [Phakopsora pachyrhizi]